MSGLGLVHFGRRKAICGRASAVKLTLRRGHTTCGRCLIELSGRDMLRDFQADLEEAPARRTH